MAFSDPITITVNAIAQTLNRVGFGVESGIFRKDDTYVGLDVRHRSVKNNRKEHHVRFFFGKVAADPFLSGVNQKYEAAVSMTINVPPTGFTAVEVKQIVDGFTTWLNASSGAALTKLIAGES